MQLRVFRIAIAAALLLPLPARAIELGMPLDCSFGEDCLVQNYVDAEPGPGARDFTCGPLAYDGHQGTDFRLLDRAQIARGYEVLATAAGRVVSAIDGQPDHGFEEAEDNPLGCGNAVMIDHGAGWVSQYCHLAAGSLRVREGQQVARGAALGLLGSSGGTDFPHLHYAIRRYGAVINPFTGVSPTGCKAPEARPLWDEATGIDYVPSAIMGFGVSGVFPSIETVKTDRARLTPPRGLDDPVYVWFQMLGARAGDSVRLMTFAPDGRPFASELFPVNADKAVLVLNIGVTPEDLDAARFPPGTYRARISVYAGSAEVAREELTFDLSPASGKHVAIGGEGQRHHGQRKRDN